MDLPRKMLEELAFNTRPKIEEHMLIVMNKSTHDENLSQTLQTNNKQFKIALTFITVYNGNFKVTDKNNNFYFTKSTTKEDAFIQITLNSGSNQIEALIDQN